MMASCSAHVRGHVDTQDLAVMIRICATLMQWNDVIQLEP